MTAEHTTTEVEPITERTVAFYAAPNAATHLLHPTISALISARDIERGLVDLSTVPGLVIATALRDADVPYSALEFGQDDQLERGEPSDQDVDSIRAAAAGTVNLAVGDLGRVDANVVLVPAAIESNTNLVDFSQGTVLGAVMSQIETAERPVLVVMPPERGLQPVGDGVYQRSIVHVAGTSASA